jgi:hypothetical protein
LGPILEGNNSCLDVLIHKQGGIDRGCLAPFLVQVQGSSRRMALVLGDVFMILQVFHIPMMLFALLIIGKYLISSAHLHIFSVPHECVLIITLLLTIAVIVIVIVILVLILVAFEVDVV